MLQEFSDIVVDNLPDKLPPKRSISHHIDFILGASVPNKAIYRISPKDNEEIRNQVQELLDKGLIRESLSPCVVLTILAPKKGGEWRMGTDSWAINKISIRYRFRLPQMDDIMDCLSGATGTAIGAVLSQEDKLVAYLSEKLNESRQKYTSYDKEFYAVVQALKHWRHYLLANEFVLFSNNSTLQYIMQQHKLNHKFVKWVEYLQSFTFALKHISGQANKVADALSRRNLILQESTIQVLGFEHLKDLYEADADFKEAYESCQNPLLRDNISWLDYNMQEGLLFKGGQLCISECSMRDNLIQEKHSGCLVRHFGIDKTLDQLSHF
eukprot:PITA_05876